MVHKCCPYQSIYFCVLLNIPPPPPFSFPDGSIRGFFAFLFVVVVFFGVHTWKVNTTSFAGVTLIFADSVWKREIRDLVFLNEVVNMIDSPTRITSHSEAILDLFVNNFRAGHLNSGVISWRPEWPSSNMFFCVQFTISPKKDDTNLRLSEIQLKLASKLTGATLQLLFEVQCLCAKPLKMHITYLRATS